MISKKNKKKRYFQVDKIKKITVLSYLLLFSSLAFSSFLAPGAEAKTPSYLGSIRFFNPAAGVSAVPIRSGETAGGFFRASSPFVEIALDVPSYSDNIGDLTLSLYRWQNVSTDPAENYAASAASPLLAQETFHNFIDNGMIRLSFKTLPPGEYLWILSDPKQRVGVWKVPAETGASLSFFNGQLVSGEYKMTLSFESAFPFSGSEAEYKEVLTQKSTAPKEKKLSPNDPINLLDPKPETWGGIDGLGRVLPDRKEAGPVRKGKQVGIFYWTWHQRGRVAGAPPFDNTKILEEHPDAPNDINHPAWGPKNSLHHWGEPLFGYYSTEDRWVLREHAELLADAQIDVVIFDATNGSQTWMNSTRALMETFAQARQDGVRTPKIAFMLPFGDQRATRVSLRQLYRDIYKDGHFQELWFYWMKKPLIYAIPESLDFDPQKTPPEEQEELKAIRQFFTFRPGQPDYMTGPTRPDHWSWLEVYPQHGYVSRSDGTFEMVSVGVAQNHSSLSYDGRRDALAAMNDRNVFGRAYRVGEPTDERPDAFLYGGNFQQQWSRAFEIDPDFVFVTGWNEWVATRFDEIWGLPNAFPDEYNEEFSRDIEPSRGRLKDHYYLQLAANVRKFKGVSALPAASAPQTIPWGTSVSDSSDPWEKVSPVFRDWAGDTLHRDAPGYGDLVYRNDTGRNDIILGKAARDDSFLYLMAETREPLTLSSDPNWMRLFIADYNRPELPHWESFAFRTRMDGERMIFEKSRGGWDWEEVGAVDFCVTEKRLEIRIPRDFLGLEKGQEMNLGIKWSDNMQKDGDILDFYENGDVAPDGRFTWVYRAED